jgi:hypothetical protein
MLIRIRTEERMKGEEPPSDGGEGITIQPTGGGHVNVRR